MRIDIGAEQLILFEDMTKPNNIAIRGSAGTGKTYQVLEIAKQVNPCKVIVISDHPEDYASTLPNIEIHSVIDFMVNSDNAIIVFDCPMLVDVMYEYVDKLSKTSRFRNSLVITVWNTLISIENSIIMNCKYIIDTSTETLNSGLRVWKVGVS